LTVLETVFGGPALGTTPKTSGKRKRTACALNVDVAVLEKLGELTTERGDAMTARKYAPRVPPLRPLTPEEADWIRAALRATYVGSG
jgi:hypothetical protein